MLRLITTFIAVAACAAAGLGQSDPVGYVHGRVLSAFGMGPVAGASVRTFVRRGERVVTLGRTRTDGEGRYRVRYGAVSAPAMLTISASGLAPVLLDLISAPNAEGILVDDVILDGGASLTVRSTRELKGVSVRMMAAIAGSRIIDLSEEPIAEAPLRDGQAILREMPPGDVLLVVGDHRARHAPRVIPWRMGVANTTLPPIELLPGRELRVRVRAPGQNEVIATALVGSGSWHPDGGEEYRLRITERARRVGPGIFDVVFANLPPGAAEIEFRGGELVGWLTVQPGGDVADVTLTKGATVEGRLRELGSTRVVGGAAILIDDRRVVADANGAFRMVGLRPGAHAMRIVRRGFVTHDEGHVVVMPEDIVLRFDIALEPMAVVDGTVRDDRGDGVAEVLVGAELVDLDGAPAGVMVSARTDVEGRYSMRVAPGRLRVKAWPVDDRTGTSRVIDVTAQTKHGVDLEVDRASSTRGRVNITATKPAVGADVYLIEAGVEPATLLSMRPAARLRSPRVHHVLTRKDGSFRFVGLTPGQHHVVVRLPQQPPAQMGLYEIGRGNDTRGFDMRVEPISGLTIDAPADVPVRIRSREPSVPDVWACSPAGGPFLVRGIPPGLHEVEPVHPWGLPPRLDRSLVSHPGDDPAKFAILVEVPGSAAIDSAAARALIETTVTVDGSAPGTTGVELTFYPVAGPPGVGPQRVHGGMSSSGDLEVELPRGTWMVVARVPGVGEGRAGPFVVPTIRRKDEVVQVLVDVLPHGRIEGRIDARASIDGVFRDLTVTGRVPLDRWLAPWGLPPRRNVVWRDGRFTLGGVPAGDVVVELSGAEAYGALRYDVAPVEIVDAGLVELDEASWVETSGPPAPARGAEDGRAPHRFIQVDAVARRVSPGRWMCERVARIEAHAVDRRTRLYTVDRGVTAFEFDDVGSSQRIRGRLKLDFDRLENHPFELIAAAGGAYDDRRSSWVLHTDDRGRFEIDDVSPGTYRLSFEYRCGEAHRYRHEVPLLVEKDRATDGDLALKTSRLDVRVVDDDGRILEGARVRLLSSAYRGGVSETVLHRDAHELVQGYTDYQGDVRFDRVPEGQWDVKVTHFEHGQVVVPGVTVSRRNSQSFQVAKMGIRRGLRVVTSAADGMRVPGIELFLFRDDTEVHEDRVFLTGQEGVARIDGLSPGTYLVVGQGPDHPAQVLGEADVFAGADGFLDATVARGGSALVTVRDRFGNSIPGARIQFAVEGGPFRLFGVKRWPGDELPASLPQSGELYVTRIPVGFCDVTASMEGYRPALLEGSIGLGALTRYDLVLEKNRTSSRTPR